MERVATVVVEGVLYCFDLEYEYVIPNELYRDNLVGAMVLVPFGRGNVKKHGLILSVETRACDEKIKPISAVLDEAPFINFEMISLLRWMKDRYHCTFFDSISVMVPSGIKKRLEFYYRISDNFDETEDLRLKRNEIDLLKILRFEKKFISLNDLKKKVNIENLKETLDNLIKRGFVLKKEDSVQKILGSSKIKMVSATDVAKNDSRIRMTEKQKNVLNVVRDYGQISQKELCYFSGVTVSVVNNLVKKGLLYYFEDEVYRSPYKYLDKSCDRKEINLSSQQEKAFDGLFKDYKKGKATVSLLYGVTGSGKTAVYTKLIDKVIDDGKDVILMVPEIALTSSLVRKFYSRYGDKVAVFHSGLSLAERADEYKKVKNGDACIAVGTRSAVFAPFENLGLIIMDEEQEYTYKSDSSPRFHARDIAKFRCNYHSAMLVVSSATPSIESYYKANLGIYDINKIEKRYGESDLPEVSIVDMNMEVESGNTSLFSSELVSSLIENMEHNKQSILLMNRRGYSTFVSCRSCGKVMSCPNCSISLTYHSANKRLMCHYCGYSLPVIEECPDCHKHEMRYSGTGTQKIEDELQHILPKAKILRLDADTTMTKFSHDKKLKCFSDKKYDIMIGTQMVAKGLDFDDVTLVGVLSADQSLYNNDFRSYERTFSLLTQVVGRAGRRNHKGRAIIQTFTPENPVIMLAAKQNYNEFYKGEIELRKAMLYPPFVDLCVIGFSSGRLDRVLDVSEKFFSELKRLASSEYRDLPLRVLSPSLATVVKINNKYRHKLIVKFRNSKKFREMISKLLILFGKNKRYNDVHIYVDVNPDVIV